MKISYIIDGYNIIYALGLLNKNAGEGRLEDARNNLLTYLSESFGDRSARVTVVFDSKRSPRGKEREQIVSGLNVVYAAGEKSADDWIEIAIEQSREPRKLVVISNDGRVQEAARRRGAQAWTDQDLLADLDTDTRKQRPEPEQQPDDRPGPDSAEEIQHWVDEFSSIVDDPELRKFLDQDRFE